MFGWFRKESQADRIEGKVEGVEALTHVVLGGLARLNRKVNTLATQEQVDRLTDRVTQLQEAVATEKVQIQEVIDLLKAANQNNPDPVLEEGITKLEGIITEVGGIVDDPTPPPDEPE